MYFFRFIIVFALCLTLRIVKSDSPYVYDGIWSLINSVTRGSLKFIRLLGNLFKFTEGGIDFLSNDSIQNAKQMPNLTPKNEDIYDFIIIGAGSAGSVLASRLSESESTKVLLLEEGGVESLPMDIPILALHQYYLKSIHWDYYTEPSNDYCTAREHKSCPLPMGKVMGGSSVVNFMIATRGNKADYDNWASITGDSNWSYENMLHYFKKLETNGVKLAKTDSKYRNSDGPMHIVNPVNRTLLADAFVEAGMEMGYQPVDYNGQQQTGFSYIQATQKDGERMSTNRAYLLPIRGRKNLAVSMHSRVVKILINSDSNKAYGVEFVKHNPREKPKRMRILARKEVILSAGAISSSQLLMLSGIGPAEHLRNHNITVLKDAPVGSNFIDHVVHGGLQFLINKEAGVNVNSLIDIFSNTAVSDYLTKREGPFTIIGSIEGLGYVNITQPESKDDLPDLELLFSSTFFGNHQSLREPFKFDKRHYDHSFGNLVDRNGWMIWPLVLQPKSRGRILLRSSNPYDMPKIIPNYWSHPDDMKIVIKGIKMVIDLSKTKAMQKYNSTLLDRGVLGCEKFTWGSDDYWECAVRAFSITLWHYAGVYKMGADDDATAVVNSRLKVKGVEKLRIVDGGVMPMVPRAHTNIPIIALAERAADIIKEDWNIIESDNIKKLPPWGWHHVPFLKRPLLKMKHPKRLF